MNKKSTAASTGKAESNRDQVMRFIDAFQSGDTETQKQLVHPDVVFHSPESLPYGGKWLGHDGWQSMKAGINEVWSELTLTIDRVIGEDNSDCFVVIASLRARSRKTGRVYESEVMEQWHWREGLLVLVKPYYWDTQQVTEVITKLEDC